MRDTCCNSLLKFFLFAIVLTLLELSPGRAWAQATISLSSANSPPGATANLNISLASGGTQVSAVQWTMAYSPTDVASISVALGPVANTAGKTVACSVTTGSVLCIAYGMNQNIISDGILATVTLGIAPGTVDTSTAVQVSGVIPSSASATQISASGSGGTVSISQPLGVTASCNPGTVTLPGASTCTGTLNGTAGSTLWSEASGPAAVTFGNASSLSTTASFSQSGTYVLTLTATSGSLSASSNVTITVNPATPPTVSAGANQTITLPATASLSGTATAGSAGSLTTLWSEASGPGAVTFGNASALSTTVSFPQSGAYVLTLTATSGSLSASSNVTITINPATPPTVSAGANQTITLPASANLSGTATPGSAGSLTTLWSEATGPGVVTFGSASALSTTVSFSQSGTYVLTLTATSGSLSASSNVTITVNPAPTITFPPIRVAAGSQQSWTDSKGNVWSADTGFLGTTSSTWGVTNSIAGTSDPKLYQNERWGPNSTPIHYQFAVPNGTFTVNLKFAELYYSGPNQRIFNIALNGQAVLSNFDEYAAAGTNFTATDHVFTLVVTNGQVDIQLLPVVSNPTICAIEIVATALAPPPPFSPIRVAAGSQTSYTDSHANVWSADTGFLGTTSSTWGVTNPIAGTTDPKLYQNERWGANITPVHYQFTVPNGTHTVNLKFAELYYSGSNQRLFNIVINGQTVLANFDEFASAGANFTATDQSFTVVVTNAQIDIQLLPVVSNPTICAIEIL